MEQQRKQAIREIVLEILELEELAPEHRAAVRRIIELCRRVVVEVRELGVVRPR